MEFLEPVHSIFTSFVFSEVFWTVVFTDYGNLPQPIALEVLFFLHPPPTGDICGMCGKPARIAFFYTLLFSLLVRQLIVVACGEASWLAIFS